MIYPVSRTQKEALLQAIFEMEVFPPPHFLSDQTGADHLALNLRKQGKTVQLIHSTEPKEKDSKLSRIPK